MTNAWMSSTLDAPSEGGGFSLLPAGLNNYTIKDADIRVNPWNSRNEVLLRLSSPEGSGEHTIPLEPWDMNAIDTFLKVFNNSLGNIGIPVQGLTAQQVLANLPNTLPTVIGNVIECNVLHEPRKPKPDGSHLKQDGTAWLNAKCYINRLVARGPVGGTSAAAQQAAYANPLDAAFAAAQAQTDDIPF